MLLIAVTVAGTVFYSQRIRKNQEQSQTADFIRTIESMKQVSQNYLNNEKGYVENWAHYISEHAMTLEQALDFLRDINTNKERFAHIVDMDSYQAYSTYYPKGQEEIDTYLKYKEQNVESEEPFAGIMQSMFTRTGEEFEVLGKYRQQETQAMAVGVGTRVTLLTEDGEKDYLLLRVIPTDVLRKSWIFPMEYSSAEVGIITRSGDYVIQSSSMKSLNFPEYIRGYNFQEDYRAGEALRRQLEETDHGILSYKNFRNVDCLWYYSSFGSDSSLDILGVIAAEDLKDESDAWYMVVLICGMLMILVLIDGNYLLGINRRLRETARQAEQASRAKTQFLSAMSHDIRTPLNAVLGMMTIAQRKADNAAYVTECMDKGIHAGKQLLTLINDVLDISKIESGKVVLNPDPVYLVEVIQDMTEMLKLNMAQKHITLESDFDSIPHPCVYADKMRLSQIYVNLLSNAVKYSKEGGRIVLRLYEEEIAGNALYTRLIFIVKNTGIGMTEEFQKNMYNNFAREINTQVNSTQGTGLGLAIVKQMVDIMDGTIECNSEPGVGTTFTVSLDLPVIETCEKANPEIVMPQSFSGMHLLIAEDNELNWEIIQEFLLEQDISCDRAENGEKCVELLRAAEPGTYDAIFMDIHMPVMNGLEATRKIRSSTEESFRKIPIIAMTADAFAEDVQVCLESGMNGHISKPIDMNQLVSYLTKIKNGQMKNRKE